MVQITRPPKSASVQLGDLVNKAGIFTKPGVVIEKKEDGTVVIDTNEDQIKKYHRHSNTTGLTFEDKERFNGIMDEIMAAESNSARIDQLQEKVDAMRVDPAQIKLSQALKNEQAQLIRISKELPRVYNYDPNKL